MGLRLNMSNDEAESEARSFEVLPTGEYVCNVVAIKPETVRPTSENAGKDYWNIHFVVDEGPYAGRAVYANVMLFEGALFAIKQLVQSIFPEDVQGSELNVREPHEFEGKRVIVTGVKYAEGSPIKRKGRITGKRERAVFEVKGYKSAGDNVRTTEKSSLLP